MIKVLHASDGIIVGIETGEMLKHFLPFRKVIERLSRSGPNGPLRLLICHQRAVHKRKKS